MTKLSQSEREILGQALRKARGDMNQKEVAAPLGTNASYISNIENGHRVPSIDMLSSLADIYETSVTKILKEAKL